jgi:hypothetical protein
VVFESTHRFKDGVDGFIVENPEKGVFPKKCQNRPNEERKDGEVRHNPTKNVAWLSLFGARKQT